MRLYSDRLILAVARILLFEVYHVFEVVGLDSLVFNFECLWW